VNQHYSSEEEFYVIPKNKFNGYIGYPFDDIKTVKIPTNLATYRSQIETLISYFSTVHKGSYLSKDILIYYLNKIVIWIKQNQSYEASKQVSDVAKFFMLFSAIAHPAIGIVLLWLKALNPFDLSPENLGQVSALSSAIFSGYWVSTIKRLNANVVDV
jgi:hypothetical protein